MISLFRTLWGVFLHAFRKRVTVQYPEEKPALRPRYRGRIVLTRDLSCGGIGLAHTEQLLPKQIVVLDAVGKLLVAEVRWCRREDDNFFVAGCRLVKTNS